MDSKMRKKISIILCVAVVVIAIAATGIFFGVRSIQSRRNVATNSSLLQLSPEVVTNTANEAIARGEVPENFIGDYIYSRVGYIDFIANKDKVCEWEGVHDANGLRNKMSDFADEIDVYGGITGNVTAMNGKTISINSDGFTVNRNKYQTTEAGSYIGNDDLTVLLDNQGNATNTYISLHYLNLSCTKSCEEYTNSKNPLLTNLYVIKTFFNKYNDPLFTVTYIFEMQSPMQNEQSSDQLPELPPEQPELPPELPDDYYIPDI